MAQAAVSSISPQFVYNNSYRCIYYDLHRTLRKPARVVSSAGPAPVFDKQSSRCSKGIQNKPDGERPTEPHTKHLWANERSHGNDDGARIPSKCTRLALWCERKTSAPGGCALTQGKWKWKSATGDYDDGS